MSARDIDKEIETSFRKLLGRSPSHAEIIDLVHIKDALGLRGDDPLWIILYALQYYQSLYKTIPAEIHAAVTRAETVISRIEPTVLRTAAPFGWRRLFDRHGLWVFGVSSVVLALSAFAMGRWSIPAPARALSDLNGGAQIIASCFNGGGKIQRQPNGAIYCFPVSADGKTFGYAIPDPAVPRKS